MSNIINQETQTRWSVVSPNLGRPLNFVDQSKAMECFLLLTQRGEQAELIRNTFTKISERIDASSEFEFAEDKRCLKSRK